MILQIVLAMCMSVYFKYFFLVHKLMEMHEGGSATTTTAADPDSATSGAVVDRPDNYEPPVLETV